MGGGSGREMGREKESDRSGGGGGVGEGKSWQEEEEGKVWKITAVLAQEERKGEEGNKFAFLLKWWAGTEEEEKRKAGAQVARSSIAPTFSFPCFAGVWNRKFSKLESGSCLQGGPGR